MVALVHVYNLLSALNEQQTNFFVCSLLLSGLKSVKALSSRGALPPCPPVYARELYNFASFKTPCI